MTLNFKRAHEVGEILFWDWTQAHLMMIRRELEDELEWNLLPEGFKKRIDFLWAPYSEISIGRIKEYDPQEPKHQVPVVGLYLTELFTHGFRLGLQNQREHKTWCAERGIDVLIEDLKK